MPLGSSAGGVCLLPARVLQTIIAEGCLVVSPNATHCVRCHWLARRRQARTHHLAKLPAARMLLPPCPTLLPQLSNQTLGDYLHQHVFKPLGMNGTFYDTTNGAAGIHASSIDNGGYVSILTASSGPQNGSLKWGQQTVTWAPGISDAPHYPGLNALTLGAGGCCRTFPS